MSKEDFLLRLHIATGLGNHKKAQLYYRAKETARWELTIEDFSWLQNKKFQDSWQAQTPDLLQRLKQTHHYVTIEDPRYPVSFRYLNDPPLCLFYKGDLELLSRPAIGVVGARQASRYSFEVLQKLIPALVEHQYVIVSGLAKGVDSWAHQLAISAGGKTIAVVGTGLDICYPKTSGNLQIELSRQHLVLSEYCNGTPPQKFHFPQRNRLIAALSQGILVTEAKQRSGSLITAQLALEYGKDVFAVPGSILTGQSTGCHQLIQDGALCVESVQDIFDALRLITGGVENFT